MSGGSCGGMRNAIAALIATVAMSASAVLVPPNFC
jgi:6-phosphofructokinase